MTTFYNPDPKNTDDNCDMQVKQHYGEEGGQVEDSGVKGFMDLNTFLMKVRIMKLTLCSQNSKVKSKVLRLLDGRMANTHFWKVYVKQI